MSCRYDAVLLDLDDTLFSSRVAKWNQHKHVALTRYGLVLEDEDIFKVWGNPLPKLIEELYGQCDSVDNILAILWETDQRFPKVIFSGVVEAIQTLAQHATLGVVTSTIRSNAINDLVINGIDVESFLFVHGADDVEHGKPDARVFDLSKALLREKLGAEASVVYVGDSLHDLRPALGAGFDFIGLGTGMIEKAVHIDHGAVGAFDCFSDATSWLLSEAV